MSIDARWQPTEAEYEEAARAYQAALPPEHYMESTPQATQREIFLASLHQVREPRPEVHYFNELLVQYPRRGQRRLGQVLPDNMVVLYPDEIEADDSYDLTMQPAPFWMLEYVSPSNPRKDYDDNMRRYQNDLRVPYYLLFAADAQEMILFRLEGRRYVTVPPDARGRCDLPEIGMAVSLLGGWVRFWLDGALLDMPSKLAADAKNQRRRAEQQARRARKAERERDEQKQRADAVEAEVARLRAMLGR